MKILFHPNDSCEPFTVPNGCDWKYYAAKGFMEKHPDTMTIEEIEDYNKRFEGRYHIERLDKNNVSPLEAIVEIQPFEKVKPKKPTKGKK